MSNRRLLKRRRKKASKKVIEPIITKGAIKLMNNEKISLDTEIEGTGKNGNITKKDVQKYISSLKDNDSIEEVKEVKEVEEVKEV